jgi:hypothetical protein
MANDNADANQFARDSQRCITATTESDMDVLKPVVQSQVSMLMMWALSVERFAENYERALDETRQATLRQTRRRLDLQQ